MCGIIGVIGHNKVSSLLIEGLKRLEYRGYDSAGIATLLNGKIDRRRSLGKIENLKKLLKKVLLKEMLELGIPDGQHMAFQAKQMPTLIQVEMLQWFIME